MIADGCPQGLVIRGEEAAAEDVHEDVASANVAGVNFGVERPSAALVDDHAIRPGWEHLLRGCHDFGTSFREAADDDRARCRAPRDQEYEAKNHSPHRSIIRQLRWQTEQAFISF